MAVGSPRRTLDEMLADACARIIRYSPIEAHAVCTTSGGMLVDVRSDTDRQRDGVIPRSLHIPRTVLEWRADPGGSHRNPYLDGLDQPVVLICDHGCSTILAAANLAELGYTHVGDVIGGYAAWREAGLPTTKLGSRRLRRRSQHAGMAGPGEEEAAPTIRMQPTVPSPLWPGESAWCPPADLVARWESAPSLVARATGLSRSSI